tara:strand:- start:3043 stop:4182 length:1140 start_codon:yes stop_codon:yes gene_type:complete
MMRIVIGSVIFIFSLGCSSESIEDTSTLTLSVSAENQVLISTPSPIASPIPVPTSTSIPIPVTIAQPTATLIPSPSPTMISLPSPTKMPSPTSTVTEHHVNPCLSVAEEYKKRCEEEVNADRLKELGQSSNYYAESFDPENIPQIASFNFSELDKFSRMSKLRSGVGHDYSFPSLEFDPDGLNCRSMKHYFIPNGVPYDNASYATTPHTFDWSLIKFFAPADGVIQDVEYILTPDGEEAQFSIQSSHYPGYYFNFLHLRLLPGLGLGSSVKAGQQIGTLINDENWGEIGVQVRVSSKESYFISFLQVVTDEVFELYKVRKVTSPLDVIVSKEQRDSNPLSCGGDAPPAARWFEGSSKYNPNEEYIIWQFESSDNWFFFD